ncbi:ester cyclase [Wenxinia marina]|uniref:Putative ester cyclase n=1 Tax=Wenxinia marina DSM 24838 TaxID=1123501 RepID=A0A0D0QFL5_9RHOB|nr:ester cyclase [Wenxinia marina]KIQ69793.1 putative ester cyclase [Wenxinia marina DSM 24838]GGL61240.1 polyketide cyclase [Wenxinia marina]
MTGTGDIDRAGILEGLRALAEAQPADLPRRLQALYAPDAEWRGSCPIDEMQGAEAIAEGAWGPLLQAIPDLERRDDIFVAGSYDGRTYVAAVGHYCGTFRQDWLTIPATGRPVFLRYGEVHRVEGGRIVQSNCLWDVLDLIRQAGFWPLPPSLGTEGRWPGPITGDGVRLAPSDAAEGEASIAQTLAMHATLHAFADTEGRGRQGLLEMPQKDHWHERMMWYGPSGIGMARGLQGFVDYHQMPFRAAFPRPATQADADEVAAARAATGGGHYIRIGDGPYSVTGGWPSRVDRHAGPNLFGLPATGRIVGMRVMDFYLHHEGRIRENWVPLDVLDLMRQLGVDVMTRMQSIFRRGS